MNKLAECIYCGSEEYYIKQSFKGACNFIIRFDNAQCKNKSKYAYCSSCDKKLFKIED